MDSGQNGHAGRFCEDYGLKIFIKVNDMLFHLSVGHNSGLNLLIRPDVELV